ncbi:hypothetical protein ACI1US_01694 [Leucobacter sp. BZR 635]
MATFIVLLLILVVAFLVTSMVFSRRAKQQDHYPISIPAGSDVQGFMDSVLGDLPGGWSMFGEKRTHSGASAEWDAHTEGGNFLNIATGNGALGSLYVLSVELQVTGTDEYGRPTQVGYDQAPPQDDYEGHVWVSYTTRGQGRTWPLPSSLKIIKAREFLSEKLGS